MRASGRKLVNLIKDNPNSDFWNVYSSSDPRFKQAVDTHYTYIGKESGMQGQRYPDIPKGMDRKDLCQVCSNKAGRSCQV
jgi:hypothetical protein